MKFEGPEKKLEIILTESRPDLRSNTTGFWDKVVQSAYTHIISHQANSYFDAYLLSESSLFVYDNRIIIITCGRSQLYRTVPVIFTCLQQSEVRYLFYERKNFIYPEAQQLADFNAETKPFKELLGGKKFLFGQADGDYIRVYLAATPSQTAKKATSKDVTLEILMHEIADEIASQFYFSATHHHDVLDHTGIGQLFAGRQILYDQYFFKPCGYSLNALLGEYYFTIHVTPEPECSYVSFETNAILDDYTALIQQVLACFRPRRFTLVMTCQGNSTQSDWAIPNHFVESYSKTTAIGGGYRMKVANCGEAPVLSASAKA